MFNRNKIIVPCAVLMGISSAAVGQTFAERVTLQKPSAEMNMQKVQDIVESNFVNDLDDLPALLPKEFRLNFILKHGRDINGPRGHLTEVAPEGLGQGSDSRRPRAILFDEETGFAVSYNGSLRQKNGDTFDMMEFHKDSGFKFWKYDLRGQESPPALNQNDCAACHGPQARTRPIFSMYPDWPGFYGSDNDEMTNPNIRNIPYANYKPHLAEGISTKHQENEFNDYMNFRNGNAKGFRRYEPLFRSEEKRDLLNYDLMKTVMVEPKRRSTPFVMKADGRIEPKKRSNHMIVYPWEYLFKLYPYRPAHTLMATRDLSRAFTMRAGLRFNVLMGRYHALNLKRLVTEHPNFKKLGKFFTYNLMSCVPQPKNKEVLGAYFKRAEQELGRIQILDDNGVSLVPADDPRRRLLTVSGPSLVRHETGFIAEGPQQTLLEYERNWMLMGLELRDVDIRYSYLHPAYENYQRARSQGRVNTEGEKMRIGYFGTYFNAYNDGSTTTDEMMAGHLVRHLVKTDERFNSNLKSATQNIRWSYVESIMNGGDVIRIDRDGNRSNGKKVSQSFFVDRDGIASDDLNLWGFSQKYGRFPARYTLDRSFFKKMDSLGTWINLPYAKEIANDHHRAPWNTNGDTGKKGDAFEAIYKGVCGSLEKSLVEEL